MAKEIKLPLRLDTEALALGYFFVLDYNYKIVREFETALEAQAFIAEANGVDIETVQSKAEQQGRMLDEYRDNLRRRIKQSEPVENKMKPNSEGSEHKNESYGNRQSMPLGTRVGSTRESNHAGGWSWDSLPSDIKQRFPPPPDSSKYSSLEEYEEARGYWQGRVGRNIGIVLQQAKKSKSEKMTRRASFVRTALIWIGFFTFIPLAVFFVIYFDEIGIKDQFVNISAAFMAWLLICMLVISYILNRTSGKLLFFDPESSFLEKVTTCALLFLFMAPVLLICISSIGWVFY